MNTAYIASLINSTLRMTTPILFATLGSALCARVRVFNIALEGQMLIATFFAIVVNYLTRNIWLSAAAGVLSGMLLSLIVAIFQIKLKAKDMIIGTSINLLVVSATSYMLYTFLGIRGTLHTNNMVSLPKISPGILNNMPVLSSVFENLTALDYVGYLVAVLLFIFLFKTVSGFHLLSVGLNKTATESLGTKAETIQILAVVASGALCGLGGVALCMGNVTMFTESMTSGRGYVALAASILGQAHPLAVMASSLFFGMALALSRAMQNTINSQITVTFPYLATILIMAIYGIQAKRRAKKI
jgi:simple sugar transport system permease protein